MAIKDWFGASAKFLVSAVLVGGLLGGCTTIKTEQMPGAEGLPLLGEDGVVPGLQYRIRPGDDLDIKFYTAKDYDESTPVRPDGYISMQRVDDIKAAGLTPNELRRVISERYTGKVSDPSVSVMVKSFKGFRVYIGGEVAKPQVIPMDGGITVMQAIYRAGGLRYTAHPDSVVLIRKSPNGEPKSYHLDLSDKAIELGKNDMAVALSPYDVIYVPRSPIANANLWVQQYITDLLLFKGINFGFSVNRNYNSGDSSDGSF
ncbi:protein involved in polysaccharide export, contains SLBB domain of the beta-grasp fold [Pseudomonas sp. ok272]|uniref:polysaccharide biosynthesis/export family protein n=1 Tax=unclassified Pseudomonas TaxID=196821 RepID=UPI0008BBA288|nr:MULTISPECIES: polysaccharide biosynthesis/export family protein [unclassified Pseudomonas]SEM86992.1 protein involved in polysaccharide export, contains SLBB domain of the beta-grasp fold [Pseudomonas sp. ok272]SFM76934.1 protein involved in polysaccharide export, contains SLBB domain of the beta-grasp fold [Pseudomonas sp. ok602]